MEETASASVSSTTQSRALFYPCLYLDQRMDFTFVGLENSGKSSLVQLISTGEWSEDMVPTIGYIMEKVTKGKKRMKLWDLGGEPRSRSMWERYCTAVSGIVYVVDASDTEILPMARSELQDLLSKPSSFGIPLLILGNKIDKPGALSEQEFADQIGANSITMREVFYLMISCKNSINIDSAVDWMVKHKSKKPSRKGIRPTS